MDALVHYDGIVSRAQVEVGQLPINKTARVNKIMKNNLEASD